MVFLRAVQKNKYTFSHREHTNQTKCSVTETLKKRSLPLFSFHELHQAGQVDERGLRQYENLKM